MSEHDKPDREKLAQMCGPDHVKPEDVQQSDREWVADNLEPVAGDKKVCELSDTEIDRFVDMTMLAEEFEELQTTLRLRMAQHQQNAMAKARDAQEFWRLLNDTRIFLSAEEAEDAWRIFMESEYQRISFWRDIRAQHSIWGDELSVRHGFVVVSTGKKYRL